MPDYVELTVADLMEIHAIGIRDHGGDPTVPYDAADHMSSVLYSASYRENALEYAAGILCFIARSQRFTDGNKRTAWGGCVRALEVNGYTLDVADTVAEAFVLSIAIENLDIEAIADQLANWLIELT